MQRNKKEIKELIRKAKRLIRKLTRDEAKLESKPDDKVILETTLKTKNVTKKDS